MTSDPHLNNHLLAIGGGMALTDQNPIIKTFAKLSCGQRGTITILPTASDHGEEMGSLYTDIFRQFCPDVEYYILNERKDADNEDLIRRLQRSTGIFFTGGDQLRITSLLGGSKVMKILHQTEREGIIVAGTSAGASAMSNTMISWERADRMTKGNLQMSPGLGLIKNIVIDSHFVKRGRITRLLHVAAQNPGILGIGLTEDSGILLNRSKRQREFTVIGSRQVFIVDGRSIEHSNMAKIAENYPFSVTNVKVHSLGPGYSYNFDSHQITYPEIPVKQMNFADQHLSDKPYIPSLQDSHEEQ
jgi:cyanophycinase